MNINDLVLYSESLYKIAYKKMNNTAEADELTQETLLQALIELRKDPDKIINNEKAWLNGILNNCFYTMMRKKYKMAYVTYDVIIDNYLSEDNINDFIDDEETREIHKKIQHVVSRLAKIHRDVIYKFYMQNKSVNQIADELDIPRGTVLSRLDNGRKMIKEGVLNMDKNLIYKPQKLGLGICGKIGDANEPFSSISTSVHQNILLNAYEKPVTESEISEMMGIPCMYIEEIVDKLIKAELMKRTSSGKVYTDFIINFEKETVKINEELLKIVNNNFQSIWEEISATLEKLNALDFVTSMSERKRNKLNVFYSVKLLVDTIANIRADYQGNSFMSFNEYPDRPNNGKWFAMGYQSTDDNLLAPYEKYNMSGMLSSDFNYKDEHIKGMDYQTSFGDTHHGYSISPQFDKFLYDIIINEISEENEKYMKDIPCLCERGILENIDEVTKLDIPQITFEQEAKISEVIKNDNIYNILKQPVLESYKKRHTSLPAHLKDSVPAEFITGKCDVLWTGFLVTAKEKGFFLKDVDYPCPAMVFVIDN